MRKYLNQSEYAREKGYNRSYITKLKQNGILAMHGKQVDVAATDKNIQDFADPQQAAVADYHAAQREKKRNAVPESGINYTAADSKADDLAGKAGSVYQHSRALNEKYKAMAAKRDYEIATGTLLVANEVAAVISDAGNTVRNRLEGWADILAPQLAAETDEAKVRVTLIDHVEQVLTELSRQFGKLAADK